MRLFVSLILFGSMNLSGNVQKYKINDGCGDKGTRGQNKGNGRLFRVGRSVPRGWTLRLILWGQTDWFGRSN
jgi:hypothetical protein